MIPENIESSHAKYHYYKYLWRKDSAGASAHTLRWLPASSRCLWDTSQQLTRAVKRRLSLRWESRSLPSYSNLGDKQTPEQDLSLFHIGWYSWVNLVVPKNWAAYFSAISGRKFDLTTVLRLCWNIEWRGRGFIASGPFFSLLLMRKTTGNIEKHFRPRNKRLSFLERLDWPNCTNIKGGQWIRI